MKVTEIMSRPVITASPETPIKDAAQLLVTHGISALPVVDRRGELIGIVSEADFLAMETRPDPRSQATPLEPTAGTTAHFVSEVMTRQVHTVTAATEVSQAARMMLEAEVKRLPVVKGRQVIGIVSRRDLVRVIARRDEDVEQEIIRRLAATGTLTPRDSVEVAAGVATIGIGEREPARRLAESIALAVPGVLEVRFRLPDANHA